MNTQTVFALIVAAAAAPAALADITYISQNRLVDSTANVSGGPSYEAIPFTNSPISAVDFTPFNERSEAVDELPAEGPPGGQSTFNYGWAEQHSSLLSDGIHFSGEVGGTDNIGFSGVGNGLGHTLLSVEFSLDAASVVSFQMDLSQTYNYITYQSTIDAVLRDSLNNEIFNFDLTNNDLGEGFFPNVYSFTFSDTLPAGSYTFTFENYTGVGGEGGGTGNFNYSGQLVVPATSSASALFVPALCIARRRRRAR